MENLNEEVHKAYEVIKRRNHPILQIPSGNWMMRQILRLLPKYINSNKEPKAMIVLMNGERMMYNVFKDIPEVAWQIMDLSENPTTIILDNPRNAANLVAPDNTLELNRKEPSLLNYWKDEKPLVSTSANISGQPTPKVLKKSVLRL
jgi:L-threonylcarbamoyladenylate synthase